jgi:hypothetical protein
VVVPFIRDTGLIGFSPVGGCLVQQEIVSSVKCHLSSAM